MKKLTRQDYEATLAAIVAAGGNRARAAEALGIQAQTIYLRLRSMPEDLLQRVPGRLPRKEGRRAKGVAKPAPALPFDEADAWKRLGAGDRSAADEIARHYQGHVRRIAAAMLAKHKTDFDQLYSDGNLGLLQAIERFDPQRGLKFWTFAASRVRGEMLDGLRKDGINSRKSLANQQERTEAIRQLTVCGAPADDAAVEAMLGTRSKLPWLTQQSLDAVLFDTDSGRNVRMGDLFGFDPRTETAAECDERVRAVLGTLDYQTQVVLWLYYWRGGKQRVIGEAIGLSESRVSQIISGAVAQLRQRGKEALLEAAG